MTLAAAVADGRASAPSSRPPCPHRHDPPPEAAARVNGVRIDPLPAAALGACVFELVRCGAGHVVQFLSADPSVTARRDSVYRDLLNRGDVNLADGTAVVAALRLLGCRAERVTGSDAFDLVFGSDSDRQLRHYLYGGVAGVAERLEARLRLDYPECRIVGVETPPFGPIDDDLGAAAERISVSGADLVWVGLGTPKQHYVADRLRQFGAAPVILCVGAAFDFVSGAKRRSPVWMQKAGLEWLHRLGSEPRRLWRRYLIGNPQFAAGVLRDVLSRRQTR